MEIKTIRGAVFLIDDADFDFVSRHRWTTHAYGYIVMTTKPADGSTRYLHRRILGVVDPKIDVDHVSGDPKDNRRANLRLATRSENMHNKKLCRRNTSGAKGVYWDQRGFWYVQVCLRARRHCGGHFKTLEEAKTAAHGLREKLHGPFARHK